MLFMTVILTQSLLVFGKKCLLVSTVSGEATLHHSAKRQRVLNVYVSSQCPSQLSCVMICVLDAKVQHQSNKRS